MTTDDADMPAASDAVTDTDVAAEEAVAEEGGAPPEATPDVGGPTREGMAWYVLRVASNKEGQIRESLERKVKIEALEGHIGRILVPTVKEKRIKAGRAKVLERKLYPGYVFVEMATEEDGAIPEHVWFLVKETMGVGDFIGSDGKPTPMAPHDVDKLLEAAERSAAGDAASAIPYKKGDRVKIREGSFENFEGDVDTLDEKSGTVTVLVTIFGRATPVDVEYWQLERL
jgi:transcriptional antiterminator NusG